MTEQTNVETHPVPEHLAINSDLPRNVEGTKNLEDILVEMADDTNLGDDFSKRDYFYLALVGLIIPFILMIWGWFL